LPLSLLTWNTLAPVYFRGRGDTVEAQFPERVLARHARICEALIDSNADVICLQEHWFDAELCRFYRKRLVQDAAFRYEALQRTAWNSDGRSEDGVAMFVRKGVEVVQRHDVRFHDYGIPQDRVALILVLRDARPAAGEARPRAPLLAVLCTHLTYPHSVHDERARLAQIGACIAAAQEKVPRGMPVVLAGDLNGPSVDGVSGVLRAAGFRNVWEEVHGRPCGVTHVDHRGANFASDHVWIRGGLSPTSAQLLPAAVPDTSALRRPAIGAAADCSLDGAGEEKQEDEEAARPRSFDAWCDLSDHRPLLVSLAWPE